MRPRLWIAVLVLVFLPCSTVHANYLRNLFALEHVNKRMAGQVVDYTHNHGHDRRIWSNALQEKRDLYIYLPPNYDPKKQYPLMVFLHGFLQDETAFLIDVIEPLDRAIQNGQLPPVIIAAPDGTLRGSECLFSAGSFFLNSKAGCYEDYLMVDVWDFVMNNYPIRPEPEAHVIAGVSMGGGGAFNKAIKYQDHFKTVAALFPPVNLRWTSCRGRYMDNFDPCCWGWRTNFNNPFAVVGRFYGVVTIRQYQFTRKLYGIYNPNMTELISRENPIEMLDAYDVKNGQLAMYIGYGGRDQFNIDAQVESFLYRAREKGITVGVGYDARGKHDVPTAMRLLPGMLEWLKPRLEPYSPK